MPTYIRVKDLPNAATSPASDDFILLSGAANGARRISRADFLAAVAGFYTADPSTYKLATLDAGNKVLVSQLPSSAFSYQGTWAASTNTPTLADGTGTGGDTYYASDSGSVNFGSGSISFLAGDAVVYDGSVWQKVPDVVNLLDGKGTLDEAKTTLEIPDVGSNPDEVSLNGMLGSMAFQSAEGISVAKAEVETLEVTDKVDGTLNIATGSPEAIADADADDLVIGDGVLTNFGATIATNSSGQAKINFADGAGANAARGQIKYDHQFDKLSVSTAGAERVVVDEYGRLGIGTSSPGSYAASANNLVVGSGSGSEGVTIASGTTGEGSIYFADGTTGTEIYRGYIGYGHPLDELFFGTSGMTRWKLNSTGNLVPQSSGLGIDFGSGASTTIDDYEEGTWSPVFAPQTGSFASITMVVTSAQYTKIGNRVIATCYINTNGLNTSGGSGPVTITGLPFSAVGFNAVAIGYAVNWIGHPAGGYTQDGTSYVILANRTTSISGPVSAGDTSNLNTAAGQQNNVMISVTYTTA